MAADFYNLIIGIPKGFAVARPPKRPYRFGRANQIGRTVRTRKADLDLTRLSYWQLPIDPRPRGNLFSSWIMEIPTTDVSPYF
ncbi:hypothetical protein RQM65_01665 [Pricia sp. S334]|uniref:Uncharacterized protein n=1 Tax=Pricia mediterranea TaxID=3076079 RepID=A0ABU3L191_9FLAO|nr:hypothetical protein [Pricia sp. S334]MDT7827370.1 hypothetical protein [Pricia sp. S334]